MNDNERDVCESSPDSKHKAGFLYRRDHCEACGQRLGAAKSLADLVKANLLDSARAMAAVAANREAR